MTVKQGYKLTEVGVIPEDWSLSKLRDITTTARPISYGIVQTGKSIQNGIPCLRVVDIKDGNIDISNLITTTHEISLSYKRTILKLNDIVMPLRGKIGEAAIVTENLVGGNLTRGVALLALLPEYSPYYIKQTLRSSNSQKRLEMQLNGSALQEIPIATLREYLISLPPTLPEQTAIANALSDADAYINSLEQLIAKKQQIKQGTMQQLLTGKKRLEGFSGEWEVFSLEDIVEFLDGKRKPVKDSDRAKMKGDYPYYGASGIVDYVDGYLFDEDLILLGEDGENILSRNTPLAFKVKGKIWVNNHAHVLRPKITTDIGFLTEFLESLDYKQYNSGTAQPKLNKQVCSKLKISVPPTKAEQTAIANILTNMDNDIQALQNKLTKAKHIKQGMMQELLTGKTRLVQPH